MPRCPSFFLLRFAPHWVIHLARLFARRLLLIPRQTRGEELGVRLEGKDHAPSTVYVGIRLIPVLDADDIRWTGAPRRLHLEVALCGRVVVLGAPTHPLSGVVTAADEVLLDVAPVLEFVRRILHVPIAEADETRSSRCLAGAAAIDVDEHGAVAQCHGQGEVEVRFGGAEWADAIVALLQLAQLLQGLMTPEVAQYFGQMRLVALLGQAGSDAEGVKGIRQIRVILAQQQRAVLDLGGPFTTVGFQHEILEFPGALPAANGIRRCAWGLREPFGLKFYQSRSFGI